MTPKENTQIEITNLTRQNILDIPFNKIKAKVLGDDYELSLVFIGEKKSKKLNRQLRNMDKPASVLSFPLDDKTGEIFISPLKARKKRADFEMSKKEMIAYIFIHGLLHLKGLEHGKEMEKEEEDIFEYFFKK